MGDLSQLIQSVFVGLFLAFIVAKLISLAISHSRDDNTNNTRASNRENPIIDHKTPKPKSVVEPSNETEEILGDSESKKNEEEEEKEKGIVVNDDDSEDDWEGVEYTELDEIFSAATAFVAASAADRLSSQKVSNEKQLELYSYYKIATEGPCNTPQPSALNMSARAKWNAWKRLGSMSPEEAMQMYITLVCELFPSWASGSAAASARKKDEDSERTSSASKGMMGPVFSSYVYEEDSQNEATLEAIHESAREGEIDDLQKYISNGVSVNLKDSEGRTPLHWAVDRGHTNIVELLLSKDVDVNAKDGEGQTALHYAAMCDRQDIAQLLVNQNADLDAKDNEGNSPCDLCETNSSWLKKP